MTAVGFAFLLAGSTSTNAALPFTILNLVGAVYAALALHMLLAYPEGRLHTRVERSVVGAGYVAATIGQLPGLLFLDHARSRRAARAAPATCSWSITTRASGTC